MNVRNWVMSVAVGSLLLTSGIAASGSALAATLPGPGQVKGTSKRVPASLFGMHVHGLTTTPPTAEERFGGIRIWDSGVRWDEVNTAKGVYDWTTLDQVVDNSLATGAKDVMYVLGYTPNWAAKEVRPPCQPGTYTECSYYPNGSASGPRDIEDWKTWVREVASRYRGKITQYQIWNEANLTSFFYNSSGDSAVEMAQLTAAAEGVIREVDPTAKVITASSTIVQNRSFVRKGWLARYLTALKASGAKPDGIGVHLYPWLKRGPGNGTLADRARAAELAHRVTRSAGYGKLPLLDTEMNFGNNRANKWPKKIYAPKRGAAFLAQTYLNSLHNGVAQVDWYGWDDFGLGIRPTSESGAVLQPGLAYRSLLRNLGGARNRGCTITKTVTVCLTQKGKQRNYYAYLPKAKTAKFTVPSSFKVTKACDLLDRCKQIRHRRVEVGLAPVRLTNR